MASRSSDPAQLFGAAAKGDRGALARLFLPPGGYRGVIAREENLGDGRTTELSGSRVLRVLKHVR